MNPWSLIDLQRYPIMSLEAPAARPMLAAFRTQLDQDGALALPGFLTESATEFIRQEARALEWASHEYRSDHTVYFAPQETHHPESHPLRKTVRTDKGNVPYDRIPGSSLLRQLYCWDGLLAFVAAVLNEPELHRHPDPMAALNINTHGPGQELGWHFDRTDFAVTLSLQTCEQGGDFEYVPNLRTRDDENFAGVARVLAGARDGIKTLATAPGTLTLFRGHYSLHRVTPGTGRDKRLMAALSYVRDPSILFSAYARQLFYGRDTPLSEAADA